MHEKQFCNARPAVGQGLPQRIENGIARMKGVRAKKSLGQHFLVDLNIARKICDALSGGTAEAPCDVLEVGCGMGVLTQFLLQRDMAKPPCWRN